MASLQAPRGPAESLWAPASLHADRRLPTKGCGPALCGKWLPTGAGPGLSPTLGPWSPYCPAAKSRTLGRPLGPFPRRGRPAGPGRTPRGVSSSTAQGRGRNSRNSRFSGGVSQDPGRERPARLHRQRAPFGPAWGRVSVLVLPARCPGSCGEAGRGRPESRERPAGGARPQGREQEPGAGRGPADAPLLSLPPPSFLSFAPSRSPVFYSPPRRLGGGPCSLCCARAESSGDREQHARGRACPEPDPGPGRSGRADERAEWPACPARAPATPVAPRRCAPCFCCSVRWRPAPPDSHQVGGRPNP